MKSKLSILGIVLVSFALLTVGCGWGNVMPTEVPIASTEEIPNNNVNGYPSRRFDSGPFCHSCGG